MLEKEQFGIVQPLPEETLYELMDLVEAARPKDKEMAPRIFVSIANNLLSKKVESLPPDKIELTRKPQTTSNFRVTKFKKERILSSFQLRDLVPHRSLKEFNEAVDAGLGDLKWFVIFTISGTHFCQFDEEENCWWSTTLKVPLKPEAGERWPELMADLLQFPLKPSSS